MDETDPARRGAESHPERAYSRLFVRIQRHSLRYDRCSKTTCQDSESLTDLGHVTLAARDQPVDRHKCCLSGSRQHKSAPRLAIFTE